MVKTDVSASLLAVIEKKGYSFEKSKVVLADAMTAVPSAGWVDIDVMDGKYVFQKTDFTNMDLVSHVCQHAKQKIDSHLMVMHPEKYVGAYASAGSDIVTFHIDATYSPSDVINRIKSFDKSNGHHVGAGLALKPDEPLIKIDRFIEEVNLILLMSVIPGQCGQKFDKRVLDKLAKLSDILYSRNPDVIIQVDGGIKTTNSKDIIDAVGNHDLNLLLVSGSGVYSHDRPDYAVRKIKKKYQ